MKIGAFITGTGTNVGKTFVTRGLARAAVRQGLVTYALKPIETWVIDHALDARALGNACGHSYLAELEHFYRAKAPVAPYAATLLGGQLPPDLTAIASCIERLRGTCTAMLVEG